MKVIWFIFVLGLALKAVAHQEKVLVLDERGVIQGLPDEFRPATFTMKNKILTVAGTKVRFGDEILRLFPDEQNDDDAFSLKGGDPITRNIPYDLVFRSSWFHGPSLLPPYLRISINPKNADFKFEVTVDLEKKEVMEAIVILCPPGFNKLFIPVAGNDRVGTGTQGNPPQWNAIVGSWQSNGISIIITERRITTLVGGEEHYPTGSVEQIGPGLMKLKLNDKQEEEFRYSVKGDILQLYLDRASVPLVRSGSEAEKNWIKRQKSVK